MGTRPLPAHSKTCIFKQLSAGMLLEISSDIIFQEVPVKMNIMQRAAQDDYHAQLIAQGMENAGADVFTVTNDSNGSILVYCKHREEIDGGWIDQKIHEAVTSKAAHYAA
jgi:hypothetical protein